MVTPLFNLMESCQKENKQLADLRDTLLPKLMTGEIDVSKIDLTQLNNHFLVFAFALSFWRISFNSFRQRGHT